MIWIKKICALALAAALTGANMEAKGKTPPGCNDFNGDGKSDFAVFCQNTGLWYVLSADQESVLAWAIPFGWPGAQPVSGDFNGDGKSDFAVFCQNTGLWYVLSADQESVLAWAVPFGWPGAQPVSGDFNGDGKSDFAVFCQNTGLWYVLSADQESVLAWAIPFGWPGAIPAGSPANPKIKLNITATPWIGGEIAGADGDFPVGSQIEITAIAYEGWIFSGWNDNHNSPTRLVSVMPGTELAAFFQRGTKAATFYKTTLDTAINEVKNTHGDYAAASFIGNYVRTGDISIEDKAYTIIDIDVYVKGYGWVVGDGYMYGKEIEVFPTTTFAYFFCIK